MERIAVAIRQKKGSLYHDSKIWEPGPLSSAKAQGGHLARLASQSLEDRPRAVARYNIYIARLLPEEQPARRSNLARLDCHT